MKDFTFFLMVITLFHACGYSQDFNLSSEVTEASGIASLDENILIVSDNDPGSYFIFPVKDISDGLTEITKASLVSIPNADLAYDLESIDVLADGRIVVLSERLRMLISSEGDVVAHYEDFLSELGARGLEGLSVKALENGDSRVAVLWEGGYLNNKDITVQLKKIMNDSMQRVPTLPFIFIHDVANGSVSDKKIKWEGSVDTLSLNVPIPSDQTNEPKHGGERFRATDLVWHQISKDEQGFIVLLTSESSKNKGFTYQGLQRFTLDGQPYGDFIDLDDKVPDELKNANWEGLGWFEANKSLMMIYDSWPKGVPHILTIQLKELW